MIRRKTRGLLQCHSSKPLPLVAVICQHELHTISSFPSPFFADLSGGPKSSNDEGTRSILQRPVPCDYHAGSVVDRRRPKFCLRPCAIAHTLQRRRLANHRRCPNHKIFRETNMARMHQYVRAVGRSVSGACSGRPLTLRLTNLGLVAPGLLRPLYVLGSTQCKCLGLCWRGMRCSSKPLKRGAKPLSIQ